MSDDDRPLCKYGADCYRKQKEHLERFSHPATKKAKPDDTVAPGVAAANGGSVTSVFASHDLLWIILSKTARSFAALCLLRAVNKRFRQVIDSKAEEAVKKLFRWGPLQGGPRTMASWLATDWFCYWDDSYGMPSNPEENYVFRPSLQECQDGFVVAGGGSFESLKAPENAMMSLGRALTRCARIASAVTGKIGLNAWGSEGSCEISVLILPWHGGKVTAIHGVVCVLFAHVCISHTLLRK
jgi:hypothetical protein